MKMNTKHAAITLSIMLTAGLSFTRADEPNSLPAKNPYTPDGIRKVPSPRKDLADGAKSVIYIIDSSQAMKAPAIILKEQLQKAADNLDAEKSFDIMTFADGAVQLLDKKLLPATPANKQKAHEFLGKLKPHGTSDPMAALRAAFAAKPEVIYFLAAGGFPKNKEVLEEIRKLNKDNKVRINTIAFINRGNDYEQLLQEIAEENGGLFKFISEPKSEK